MFFKPPNIQEIRQSSTVLGGGRTRLLLVAIGWGRLTVAIFAKESRVEKIHRYIFGEAHELFIDVLPPCEVMIRFRNLFGVDSMNVPVRSTLPGVLVMQTPVIGDFPRGEFNPRAPEFRLSQPVVVVPEAPRVGVPRVALGSVSIKKFFGG